jgi:hypothetical protein
MLRLNRMLGLERKLLLHLALLQRSPSRMLQQPVSSSASLPPLRQTSSWRLQQLNLS